MPTVPAGGLILVTGANGYVAGITVQVLLARGFRVRGTVRDVSKHSWMQSHYGANFSLVSVPEMSAPCAFDEAVKGVDGVAHIASNIKWVADPKDYIPELVQSAVGLLESASKESSVKSVVYTSSQASMIELTQFGTPYHITPSTYNEACKVAWTLPPSEELPRKLLNYMCGKVEADQGCFRWVKENKPNFTFNVVVPNINFGTMVNPKETGFISSSGLLQQLWLGQSGIVQLIPPEWYVDVEDCALLHAAVLTLDGVENERVLAFGARFGYNELLDIFKKVVPGRHFLDKVEETPDIGTVENERGHELLKRMGKENGFSSLEEGVRKWIPWMLKAEEEGWAMPKSLAEEMS
jgi:nucleoside-diphosphate-sugar epimerase